MIRTLPTFKIVKKRLYIKQCPQQNTSNLVDGRINRKINAGVLRHVKDETWNILFYNSTHLLAAGDLFVLCFACLMFRYDIVF